MPAMSIPDPVSLDNLLSLHGRCAVVTGGSRGLGEAIVRRLAEAGASVVLTGRGREALQRVEAQVVAAGGTAVGIQADAARVEDARRVINLTVERFGTVDILVNNAAVFPASLATEMSEAVWDETVDTDLKGAFFTSQFAANAMIAAGRGAASSISCPWMHSGPLGCWWLMLRPKLACGLLPNPWPKSWPNTGYW
jgi:NAD(P)-dependent dehydrogenase (short-subunit alcohol dehydrogenase family)